MRYRPIRKNYDIGVYGDISYLERLERYCTFLENKQKQLTMRDVGVCGQGYGTCYLQVRGKKRCSEICGDSSLCGH